MFFVIVLDRLKAPTPRLMIAYKFTYINLAFAPAPDDTVSNLFKVRVLRHLTSKSLVLISLPHSSIQSFATEGHLIVNYR